MLWKVREILDYASKNIPEKIAKIAKALLAGLHGNPLSNYGKIKDVLVSLINFLKDSDVSGDASNEVLSVIVAEAPSSVQNFHSVMNDFHRNLKWFDAFPTLMQILSGGNSLSKDDDFDNDSSAAKSRIVEEICEAKWSSLARVKVLSILREISLTNVQLKMVSARAIRELKLVTMEDLPPYVYQLLLFSSLVENQSVIKNLLFYLSKLAEKLVPSIDNSAESDSGLKEALGTVILHFMYVARQNQEFGQYLITAFKEDSYYEIGFFKLALVLAISRTMRFHDQAVLAVKNSFLQCLKVAVRRSSSPWLQQTLPAPCDVEHKVKTFVQQGTFGWEHVTESLCEIGFAILEGTTNNSNKSTKFIKDTFNWTNVFQQRCRHVAKLIIIQCFKSRTKIIEAMSLVTVLPSDIMIPFLEALFVIVELCTPIRDALFSVLKNGIFSKEPNSRKVAVNGFVLFLDRFRIIDSIMSSQSSQFSQTFPTFSSSQGFCTLVSRNHIFVEPIVDVLLPHFERYLEMSNGLPERLNLESCVATSKEHMSLLEPLGVLIHCLTMCLKLSADFSIFENCTTATDAPISKVKHYLDLLCEKLKEAELEDFNLVRNLF
ncbi:unnamed protein product [Soboliphyme baturini]|uniref:Fanconi anemia group I protein n=1 Tax=Soboliphyme baturini TaxID=241478 RepID=A0A183IHQ6_9BILA|nr:unnamed protein product [Soboliphyme baturini]